MTIVDRLFPLFFLLGMMGCALFILIRGVRDLRRSSRVPQWPQISARVLTTEVQRRRYGKSPRYVACVTYTYKVDETTYEGTTTSGKGYAADRYDEPAAQLFAKGYPPGHVFTIYHHPRAPQESLIEPVPARQAATDIALSAGLIVILGLASIPAAHEFLNYVHRHAAKK